MGYPPDLNLVRGFDPSITARDCILTFLLGSSMDFTWAPFVTLPLAGQTIINLHIFRRTLLFWLWPEESVWGHSLRLPSVGGAPGVGHTQGQLLPSGTSVLLLVLLMEGRPQGHTGHWAGDGGPLLQAGWRPAGSLIFCPDFLSSCSCTFSPWLSHVVCMSVDTSGLGEGSSYGC